MKNNTLTIATLLWMGLLPLHIAGDMMYGFDKGGPGLLYVVVPILVVAACGVFVFAGTRLGYVITFIGGLASLLMPVIHRNNGFTVAVAKQPGGMFFIWTLVAMGVAGALSMILSVVGFRNIRSRTAA